MAEEDVRCSVKRHIYNLSVPMVCEICNCGCCKEIAVAAMVDVWGLATKPRYYIKDGRRHYLFRDVEWYRTGGDDYPCASA